MIRVPIRVLVADDHPMFRYGLRAAIAGEPSIELVGEAENGEEAVQRAAQLQPDVVLMDLTMPGLGGVAATEQIVAADPGINVLVITMFDDSASVRSAIRAGACGYLVKGADRAELVRAIHAAAAGEAIFSPAVARQVREQLASPRRQAEPPAGLVPGLTVREHEILELMVAGQTNAAIAQHFTLSPKTVRNYISTILAKLGADNRAEAISRGRAAGMG